jgi:hypothetical protein
VRESQEPTPTLAVAHSVAMLPSAAFTAEMEESEKVELALTTVACGS